MSSPGAGFGARMVPDDADAEDDYLYSEITGLGERLESMARYTALLIDAAGHAAAAFESLMLRRTRRPGRGHARTAVAAPVRRLVADVALALVPTPRSRRPATSTRRRERAT
jgi:hypothetical protein